MRRSDVLLAMALGGVRGISDIAAIGTRARCVGVLERALVLQPAIGSCEGSAVENAMSAFHCLYRRRTTLCSAQLSVDTSGGPDAKSKAGGSGPGITKRLIVGKF